MFEIDFASNNMILRNTMTYVHSFKGKLYEHFDEPAR